MHVIVVGAGIGGLSAALSLSLAGHRVTILESASALAEVGAGVQLSPNSTKCFWEWGLGPDILEYAVLPKSFNIRQGTTGELLRAISLDDFTDQYGAPYLVIHRADIHRILHQHGVKAGMKVELNRRVVEYDFEGGGVRLADGEELHADLVVAVDGIDSFARRSFLEQSTGGLEKTGWAAYRMMASVEAIKANPQTAHLVAEHNCNCWTGDRQSVMTYMVKNSQTLNVVVSHPDDVDTTGWTSGQYEAEISKLFSSWNPSIKALLSIASSRIQNWPVYQVIPLSRWTSGSGRFVLMGDAAHAMAFYLSMGISMAVEDAQALAHCISLKERYDSTLGEAMAVFERVRRSRVEAVRLASLHAGNMLHLPKGHDQELRDQAMKDDGRSGESASGDDFYTTKTTYGLADGEIRDWCYSYDIAKEVQTVWHEREY